MPWEQLAFWTVVSITPFIIAALIIWFTSKINKPEELPLGCVKVRVKKGPIYRGQLVTTDDVEEL